MTSVLGYTETLFRGGAYPFHPEPLPTFHDEILRFHAQLTAVGDLIRAGTPPCSISTEQLLQGPLADTMTHVGQLALLRRLSGAPIPPENFIHAEVSADRLGSDQAAPASPDELWPERPDEISR
jgi:hypothetical protein